MPESSRSLALWMSIPADAAFREVATGLAVKIAEYFGCNAAAAAEAGHALDRLVARVTAGGADVAFTFEARERTLTIRAESGDRQGEATCDLPQ